MILDTRPGTPAFFQHTTLKTGKSVAAISKRFWLDCVINLLELPHYTLQWHIGRYFDKGVLQRTSTSDRIIQYVASVIKTSVFEVKYPLTIKITEFVEHSLLLRARQPTDIRAARSIRGYQDFKLCGIITRDILSQINLAIYQSCSKII